MADLAGSSLAYKVDLVPNIEGTEGEEKHMGNGWATNIKIALFFSLLVFVLELSFNSQAGWQTWRRPGSDTKSAVFLP